MNLNNAPQRIRWGVIALLIGIAIFLSILDNSGNLDNALAFLRNPLIAILDWTSARTDTLADALSGPRDLQEAKTEIERLQERLDALERENEELRESQGEAQLLFDLFNRARQAPELTRVTANVIGQDTNPAIRSIIIDKGSEDGILVGMPVESARGLVGRVFRTAAKSSQVVLITDSASAIPTRLGTSRATGILRGGGLGGSMAIDWLDLKYQVEIGEVVSTSGLGGKFPQGIVIGRVIEVERREAELFQRAIVQPAVDTESLEIVFVITDFQPIETDIFSDTTETP
ncbi:MAG: rod shape-determining protein MreC [Ardenticatenaceae bacterium]|nr:rod shape-determining protein MreC [Ardenticatenaceae bacterium]